MIIQINGKEYFNAGKDNIVIKLSAEEKNVIIKSNPKNDLFGYFPIGTKDDAKQYHVKKLDDWLVKNDKSPTQLQVEELVNKNEELEAEIEKLKSVNLQPEEMPADDEEPGLEIVPAEVVE